jgi:hypothetical protein
VNDRKSRISCYTDELVEDMCYSRDVALSSLVFLHSQGGGTEEHVKLLDYLKAGRGGEEEEEIVQEF